jgi:hypothetical protein
MSDPANRGLEPFRVIYPDSIPVRALHGDFLGGKVTGLLPPLLYLSLIWDCAP